MAGETKTGSPRFRIQQQLERSLYKGEAGTCSSHLSHNLNSHFTLFTRGGKPKRWKPYFTTTAPIPSLTHVFTGFKLRTELIWVEHPFCLWDCFWAWVGLWLGMQTCTIDELHSHSTPVDLQTILRSSTIYSNLTFGSSIAATRLE